MASPATGDVVGAAVAGAVLTGDVVESGVAGALVGIGDDGGGVDEPGGIGEAEVTRVVVTVGALAVDVVAAVVTGWVVGSAGEVHASNSDNPMLAVLALTAVILSRTLLVARGANETVCAAPALFNAGTGTEVPSSKMSRPPVT